MKTRRPKSSARVTAPKKAVARKPVSKAPSRSAAKARGPVGVPVQSLGADCTIEHAPALHKQLGKVLENRACVTLDFSQVKRCDTAGLQVLVAFIRERREAGRPVQLQGVQDNFVSTASLLGLSALFAQAGDPAAQAGHA